MWANAISQIILSQTFCPKLWNTGEKKLVKKKSIAQMSPVCECVCGKKISKVLAARNYFPVLNLIIQKDENELLHSADKISILKCLLFNETFIN